MTKAKFEIGETEKHPIIVNASALLKYIKIEVDGEKVVNEVKLSAIGKEVPVGRGKFRKASFGNQRWTVLAYQTIVDGKEAQKT